MKPTARAIVLLASIASMSIMAGCNRQSPVATQAESAPAVSEADAAAAANATQAAWTSMDPAKIESVYAKDVVAFDPVDPPLSTTWENWDRLQKGFAEMKFDGMKTADRKIQVLDDDNFIVSGTGQLTSSTGKVKQASMRFTDVYHRQPDGKWLIVNEHVSMKPAAPATQ